MRQFLNACRYLLILPVIGSVLLTAGAVVMGIGRIFTAAFKIFGTGDFSPKMAKEPK